MFELPSQNRDGNLIEVLLDETEQAVLSRKLSNVADLKQKCKGELAKLANISLTLGGLISYYI